MGEIDSTLNTSISDDITGYHWSIDSEQDGLIKSKLWDGTNEVTVTGNKLDVNATVSSGVPALHSQPVHEWEGYNTTRNKITYVVPVGKIFYLLYFSITSRKGDIYVEWESDTVEFDSQVVTTATNSHATTYAPVNIPFGPFAAGVEIRARRQKGDTNENWSATMVGYLIGA